jgi:histidyl-tRNA synthetase
MLIQKPKGTLDILPEDAFKRTFAENKIREMLSVFNYKEIRTPAFEKTELFRRGIGEETDIVSKEMYSFNDDEFTLKPEMTAPVIRAFLENSLFNVSPLQKLFYIDKMYRKERPQAGRYREFSQFGAEAIGSDDPFIDAEIIILCDSILKSFEIKNYKILINTIGSPEERKNYISEFKNYLSKYIDELSADSRKRFEKNPLRILDTKDENDKKVLENAPLLNDFLTEESIFRFEKVLKTLDTSKIGYEINNRLVRGLDYYTDTTFEFISESLGAQNSILGGGRYDNLVSQLGGKPTPAIGFACGIERLMMLIGEDFYPGERKVKIYIAYMGNTGREKAFTVLNELRNSNITSETDYLNRSLKAQLKNANRIDAEYVAIIGDEELRSGKIKLKKMSTGEEKEVEINGIKKELQQ